MFPAHHITKACGLHVVLRDIPFNISFGDFFGMKGSNG